MLFIIIALFFLFRPLAFFQALIKKKFNALL